MCPCNISYLTLSLLNTYNLYVRVLYTYSTRLYVIELSLNNIFYTIHTRCVPVYTCN